MENQPTTENEKLYIGIIILLVVLFGTYIYSNIVMEKRTANWTRGDWEKYDKAQQQDEYNHDYQLGGGNPLGD
jgi:hypothetical protein